MKVIKLIIICLVVNVIASVASAVVLDFQTEDDFVTPLVNGQAIDTEFGNLVTISSRIIGGDGHLGPAIFDSIVGGDNDYPGAPDLDLLVGLGNVLILQNDDHPVQSIPGIFDIPDDEASYDDRGAIIFNFLSPVETKSIDLVDIDSSVNVEITLTDTGGKRRIYSAGPSWTTDVTVSGDGWETLDLTTLNPQPADGSGGAATVTLNEPGFNRFSVEWMDVAFIGRGPSGAIDNVTFVPEPATIVMLAIGAFGFIRRK